MNDQIEHLGEPVKHLGLEEQQSMSDDTQPLTLDDLGIHAYSSPDELLTLNTWSLELPHHLFQRIVAVLNKMSPAKRTVTLEWMKALYNNPNMLLPDKQVALMRGMLSEDTAKISLEGMHQTGSDFYEIETPGYEPQPEPHQHTFQFLMNANHNALRGCVTCGATWVGYMAGGPDTLHWHPVAEIEETQEQD